MSSLVRLVHKQAVISVEPHVPKSTNILKQHLQAGMLSSILMERVRLYVCLFDSDFQTPQGESRNAALMIKVKKLLQSPRFLVLWELRHSKPLNHLLKQRQHELRRRRKVKTLKCSTFTFTFCLKTDILTPSSVCIFGVNTKLLTNSVFKMFDLLILMKCLFTYFDHVCLFLLFSIGHDAGLQLNQINEKYLPGSLISLHNPSLSLFSIS